MLMHKTDHQLCTHPNIDHTQMVSQFPEAPRSLTAPSTPSPHPAPRGTWEVCGPLEVRLTTPFMTAELGKLCLESGGPSLVRILGFGALLQGNCVMFLCSKFSKSQKHYSHFIFWKPVGLKLTHLSGLSVLRADASFLCKILAYYVRIFSFDFIYVSFLLMTFLLFLGRSTSQMRMSSLNRKHANLLCIIPLSQHYFWWLGDLHYLNTVFTHKRHFHF